MSDYLWRFDCRFGRMGSIHGLFVATEQDISKLTGQYAYFGEALGKHSEVYCDIEETFFTKIDLDSETVEKVSLILGYTWSGYNPLRYVKWNCVDCEDRFSSDEVEVIDDEKRICYDCLEKRGISV